MACERPSLKLGIQGAKTLREIVMKKQMYELRVACLNLGTGHGRSKGKRGTRNVSNLRQCPTNMGVRAEGGGREEHFNEFLQLVKIYADVERLRGHHLEPDDVFREFKDQVQKRIDIFSFKQKYWSCRQLKVTRFHCGKTDCRS